MGVFEYFMMSVRFSIWINWYSQTYAVIYLLAATDYKDYEQVLGMIGFVIWVAGTFAWQYFFGPPTIAWYRIAKGTIYFDEFTAPQLRDTKTPNLDDMSYLDP